VTRSKEIKGSWCSKGSALYLNSSKSSLLIVNSSTLLSHIQSFDISLSIPFLALPLLRFLMFRLTLHGYSSHTWPSNIGLFTPVYIFFILFSCCQKLLTSQLLVISLSLITPMSSIFQFLINNSLIMYCVFKILSSYCVRKYDHLYYQRSTWLRM